MVSYWKNVSIKKISEASGYGTATVIEFSMIDPE